MTGQTGPSAPAATGPYCQMALEQAPNYEGADNAVSTYVCYPPFEELTDNEKMVTLEQKQVASGFLGPLPHAGPAKFEPEFALGKCWPRPSHLGLLLAMMMGHWTSVAGDGTTETAADPDGVAVPVGGYLHTFDFKFDLSPQTAQMRANTGNGEHRFASGVALSELPFAWENGAMVCNPKGLSLVMKGVDVGGAEIPTEVTPVIDLAEPYRRGDLTIVWLDGSAFTKEFTFALNAGIEALASPLAPSLYPTGMLFKEGELPFVSGEIDKATLNDADWAALATPTQFAAKIKVAHRSIIGSGTYQPAFWVVVPACELTQITRNAIKAERRREGKYAWQSRLDISTGLLCTVVVVNETPNYKAGWTS